MVLVDGAGGGVWCVVVGISNKKDEGGGKAYLSIARPFTVIAIALLPIALPSLSSPVVVIVVVMVVIAGDC